MINRKITICFSVCLICIIGIIIGLVIIFSDHDIKDYDSLVIILISLIILITNIAYSFWCAKRKINAIDKRRKSVEFIKDLIVEKIPNAVIAINTQGVIEYLNPAVGAILGSTDTLGMNILEFDTVKNSGMYAGIQSALNGLSVEIKQMNYTSYTTKQKKCLNVQIFPEINSDTNVIEKVFIIITDMSEELNLRNRMEKNYLDTIETLASLVDARDAYTGEHSKNVSKCVANICNNLDIPKEEKDKIVLSSAFHDIGKIGVSDFILNKPGKLTDEEFEKMKKHPTLGADIIKKIDGFKDISDIIRHHHERWDGRGYPKGLKGNEIPFGAQIIAIADTFDAIVSDRVYRKGQSKEIAMKIIKEQKGLQFNPDLVEIFLNLF